MPRSSLLNIPYEGTQQIEPTALPDAHQNIHVDADMFGALQGQALQKLGSSIEGLGSVIGEIDKKNQVEQADTLTRQIDTQGMKDYTELKENYRMMDPDKAVAGFDDYDKQARAIADKMSAAAGSNKFAQKIIARQSESYYRNAWEFGFGVKTAGVRKAADQTSDARVDQAIQSASVANDEKAITDPDKGVIAIINGETYSKGKRNGWSDEVIADQAAKKKSSAYGMFIGNMAQDNPSMAQTYYDKYSPFMTESDREVLRKKIDARTTVITGPDAGNDVVSGTPSKTSPRYPVIGPGTITEPPAGPGGKETPYKPKTGQVEGGPQVAALDPHGHPGDQIPGYTAEANTAAVKNYIVQQASLRGIAPGVALAVFNAEGSSRWQSTVPGEQSWGPFQLHTGGGLGDEFQMKVGDPRDPKTWKENIEFALNKVVEGGWGPWMGAKAKGITGMQGVASNAQTIPVGQSGDEKYSKVTIQEDLNEEEHPQTPVEERTIGAYIKEQERGVKDAMAKPGSNVIHAYNTLGRIRVVPPAPQLEKALDTAAKESDVQVRITSAGQASNHDPAAKDQPGGWTGSHRHDNGNAVDLDIIDKDGKTLSRDDPRRLKFLETVARLGAGGIGAGYMSDSLKVHVGITGGSGEVGKGLGAYAGNTEERQAVAKGLQDGGYDASTQFARSKDSQGNIRVASLYPTGTMSDAPQPGFRAGAQYAQNDSVASPTSNRAPITADTPLAEVNARIDEKRQELNGLGYGKETLDAMENQVRRQYQKMTQERADTQKRATETIGNEIYGDALKGVPPAENLDNIKRDPSMSAAWDALTPAQRKDFEAANLRLNSANENRQPTAEDMVRFNNLLATAATKPDEFTDMNPYGQGLPKRLAAELQLKQKSLIAHGLAGDPMTKLTHQVLTIPSIIYQMDQAGIMEKDSKGNSVVPTDFAAKLQAEIQLHIDTHNGKPPDREESNKLVNGLLRTMSKPPTTFFERMFGTSSQRSYKVPMTQDEQDVMVKEYKQRNPGLVINNASDIPPWEQAIWQANRRVNTKE